MQMVGNFRRFRFLPEETPFKETGIDLAVPNIASWYPSASASS
jgi:hypothetical protein